MAEQEPENQKKARVFFDQGKKVADTGNYEYAIDMYLEGLKRDPENIDQLLQRRGDVPITMATVVPLGWRGRISSRPRIRSALSAMIARP